MRLLFTALVRSHLEFGNVVWPPLTKFPERHKIDRRCAEESDRISSWCWKRWLQWEDKMHEPTKHEVPQTKGNYHHSCCCSPQKVKSSICPRNCCIGTASSRAAICKESNKIRRSLSSRLMSYRVVRIPRCPRGPLAILSAATPHHRERKKTRQTNQNASKSLLYSSSGAPLAGGFQTNFPPTK